MSAFYLELIYYSEVTAENGDSTAAAAEHLYDVSDGLENSASTAENVSFICMSSIILFTD